MTISLQLMAWHGSALAKLFYSKSAAALFCSANRHMAAPQPPAPPSPAPAVQRKSAHAGQDGLEAECISRIVSEKKKDHGRCVRKIQDSDSTLTLRRRSQRMPEDSGDRKSLRGVRVHCSPRQVVRLTQPVLPRTQSLSFQQLRRCLSMHSFDY